MTRQEEKQHLRGTIRRMEQQLSDAYRLSSSRAICAQLLAMPEYQAAEAVFCFVGTGGKSTPVPSSPMRWGRESGCAYRFAPGRA